MEKPVEVVLANNDRVTLRVGDTFLNVDAGRTRTEVEVEAIGMAPVPTPEILWQEPPVLALAALRGQALGRLGEPSSASPAAWAAVGAAIRKLHDSPLPPWPGTGVDQLAARLSDECDWLVVNEVLPVDVIERNRRLAETVLRPWMPAFIHGDLHIEHVFVDRDEVTGIIDWSEARQGDPLVDLASLTLANEEHLEHLIAGVRRRRRSRHDSRLVVVAMPRRGSLAVRERLRLTRPTPRGCRAAIAIVISRHDQGSTLETTA